MPEPTQPGSGRWPTRRETIEILADFYSRRARLRRALLRWRWRRRDRRAEEPLGDFMDVGRDDAWDDSQVWNLDGAIVSERQVQEALEEYRRSGTRPDWWGDA